MSSRSSAETIEIDGCRVAASRVDGPEASELFLHAVPVAEADARPQSERIYRALVGALEAQGSRFESVVSERVFLCDPRADLATIRDARENVLAKCGSSSHRPGTTEIRQPPLQDGARLAVSLHAVLPRTSPFRVDGLKARARCRCAECTRSSALRTSLGEEVRLYSGALYGSGATAYEQAISMFEVAEELLQQAGLEFGDVVRTWIHLRDIDRDYDDLNRARRAFFEARGIDPAPASTGIGGGPVAEEHDLCLGFYAAKADRPLVRSVMTSPTLNEAPQYGADFVRGMKVVQASAIALHVSGTASIDEAGRTAHPGDFEGQVGRMLVNVAALLEGQGADFGDVVSAITYLKRPADAARLRQALRDAGFDGFPNALVAAAICRPELLCETEVLAVLPGDSRTA